jgi:hypothetical protein
MRTNVFYGLYNSGTILENIVQRSNKLAERAGK